LATRGRTARWANGWQAHTASEEKDHVRKATLYATGIGDDETKVGVLIFETTQGNFDFAVNLQAVDVLTKAINKIEMHLRSGWTH